MEDIKQYMKSVGVGAHRSASRRMAQADTNAKNHALKTSRQPFCSIAARSSPRTPRMSPPKKNGLDPASIDRLTLTDKTLKSMAEGVRQIAALRDPIGETR